MEPEPSLTPNDKGDSTLHHAATPWHSRSAVRALLGLPEAEEENLTPARMIPPVGFPYHLRPPTGEVSRLLETFEDTVASAVDVVQTSAGHSTASIPEEAA